MTEKENDFGFSFEDTQDYNQAEIDERDKKLAEYDEWVKRLISSNREMYRRIAVLLSNLKKNPEKPMINWPDRVKKIDAFLAELEELREKG